MKTFFLNHTDLNYLGVDVFEMRGKERVPEYKQDFKNFGEDIERKHQGQIFEEKFKKMPTNLIENHMKRKEWCVEYKPTSNVEDFFNKLKQNLGYNTSPRSCIEKGVYNVMSYKEKNDSSKISLGEYISYHTHNTIINTIKGTADESTDYQFSASIQDFSYDFDKKNQKNKFKP